MREERRQLVASRPGLKIGEVTKVLAARWNKLGAGEKENLLNWRMKTKIGIWKR